MRFEFVEREPLQLEIEPGFTEFPKDSFLSGSASKEEIELLKKLRFNGKRPTPLYYYRDCKAERPSPFSCGKIGRRCKIRNEIIVGSTGKSSVADFGRR